MYFEQAFKLTRGYVGKYMIDWLIDWIAIPKSKGTRAKSSDSRLPMERSCCWSVQSSWKRLHSCHGLLFWFYQGKDVAKEHFKCWDWISERAVQQIWHTRHIGYWQWSPIYKALLQKALKVSEYPWPGLEVNFLVHLQSFARKIFFH